MNPRLLAVPVSGLVLVACGSADPVASYDPATDRSDYSHERGRQQVPEFYGTGYEAEATLADGRQVVIYVNEGTGLFEQHRRADGGQWSEPHLLFETDEDTCQSPELSTKGPTVAARFDFGIYCYDGEPPEQSIAAVATGDLTDWDVHLQEGSDGYDRAAISQDGSQVTFTSNSPEEKVVWRRGEGFD